MKYLKQFALLIGCYILGHACAILLGQRIPANILGMVVLFVLLLTHVIKLEHVEQTSDFLLQTMAIFFLPSVLSIIEEYPLIQNIVLQLLLICVVTTLITAATTGFTVQLLTQWLQRRAIQKDGGRHHE